MDDNSLKKTQQTKRQLRQKEEDEEEYYMYMPRKMTMDSINTDKSIFDQNIFEGINSRESVFDRKAIFHTQEIRKNLWEKE